MWHELSSWMKATPTLSTYASTLVVVVVASALVSWIVLRRFLRPQGWLPPGPSGFPLVGIVPFLGDKNPQHKISEWGKKYGSMYSMYFGSNLAVVLNDFEAVQEAYEHQAETFSGRPHVFTFEEFYRPGFGLINSEGSFFRAQRRFLLRTFHELGVGKTRFEQLCIEEAQAFVHQLIDRQKSIGSNADFDPEYIVHAAIANETSALVYGARFAYNDQRLHDLVESQREGFALLSQAGPLLVFPWLRHVPPFRNKWKSFVDCIKQQRSLSEFEVQRIAKEFLVSENAEEKEEQRTGGAAEPQSAVEHFLAARARMGLKDDYFDSTQKKRATRPTTDAERVFQMQNVLSNVEGLFGAATDTSVVTLLWSMIFLIHYPEIQDKCYREIMSVVGDESRPITWEDRHQLPYIEAFMNEVWRRANLIPLSIQRRTTTDTHLQGYYIPKHAIVIPNLWHMHWDERYFPQPLEFRPERFLDEKTGLLKRSSDVPSFWPFSVGKRACVGEGIARMALFVMLANMLRSVEVKQLPGTPLPSLDNYTTGSTLLPAKFNICVKIRA